MRIEMDDIEGAEEALDIVEGGGEESTEAGVEPYWMPKVFSDRHRRVVELSVIGWTNNSICKLMNYTPARVSVILSMPQAQAYAAELRAESQEDFATQLMNLRGKAIATIDEVLTNAHEKGSTRVNASFGVLDRTGHGKIETQKRVIEFTMTADAAEALKAAANVARELKNIEYKKLPA